MSAIRASRRRAFLLTAWDVQRHIPGRWAGHGHTTAGLRTRTAAHDDLAQAD